MTRSVTPQEQDLVNSLAALWNAYLELPVEHPMERDEFCRAIHVLQNMILSRAGRREINA